MLQHELLPTGSGLGQFWLSKHSSNFLVRNGPAHLCVGDATVVKTIHWVWKRQCKEEFANLVGCDT